MKLLSDFLCISYLGLIDPWVLGVVVTALVLSVYQALWRPLYILIITASTTSNPSLLIPPPKEFKRSLESTPCPCPPPPTPHHAPYAADMRSFSIRPHTHNIQDDDVCISVNIPGVYVAPISGPLTTLDASPRLRTRMLTSFDHPNAAFAPHPDQRQRAGWSPQAILFPPRHRSATASPLLVGIEIPRGPPPVPMLPPPSLFQQEETAYWRSRYM